VRVDHNSNLLKTNKKLYIIYRRIKENSVKYQNTFAKYSTSYTTKKEETTKFVIKKKKRKKFTFCELDLKLLKD